MVLGMRTVVAVLGALWLAACGGRVESTQTATTDAGGPYVRSETSAIPVTGTGAVATLGVSCEQGEALVSGGCDVTGQGSVVQSMTTGLGWTCSVTSTADNATLHAWVECER